MKMDCSEQQSLGGKSIRTERAADRQRTGKKRTTHNRTSASQWITYLTYQNKNQKVIPTDDIPCEHINATLSSALVVFVFNIHSTAN